MPKFSAEDEDMKLDKYLRDLSFRLTIMDELDVSGCPVEYKLQVLKLTSIFKSHLKDMTQIRSGDTSYIKDDEIERNRIEINAILDRITEICKKYDVNKLN